MWTLHAGQERGLNGFHVRCLRKILQIYWQDRVLDTEVLKRAGIQSLYPVLRARRLRWLGHFAGMDDSRILKQMGNCLRACVMLESQGFTSRTSARPP